MSRTGRTGGGGGADTFTTQTDLTYTDRTAEEGGDLLSITGSVEAAAFDGLTMNPKTYNKTFIIPPNYNASLDGGIDGVVLGVDATITVSSGSDLRIT